MMFRYSKGFTLLEILFVVIVIAILAAIALGRITTTTATAKANACKANQAIMNTQIEQYRLDTGDWPDDLTDVTQNTTYFPDGEPECPSDGTYTMDSDTHRTTCSITAHKLHPSSE